MRHETERADLQVRGLIGPRAITAEDGQRIYNIIHPVLINGESAVLDFEGVAQFAAPFFNQAVGQLLKDLTVEDLRTRLHILNLTADGMGFVGLIIENASRYHSDASYRRIVDSVLEKRAEESA